MKHRMRLLATMTLMVVALSVGSAGAQHGGDDFVVSGEIIGPTAGDPQLWLLNPCGPPTIVDSVQGVTQFIVNIPEATWNHNFTLVGDDVVDDDVTSYVDPGEIIKDVDMFFFAKSGTTCTQLESPYGSGLVTQGTTHGVVVLFGAGGDFTLTIDN